MAMVPNAIAVCDKLEASMGPRAVKRFATGVFLGIAYAASIGGVATLIGTPPNLVFLRIFEQKFPEGAGGTAGFNCSTCRSGPPPLPHPLLAAAGKVSFASWFLFGLPTSMLMFACVYVLFVCRYCPPASAFNADTEDMARELRSLGPMKREVRPSGHHAPHPRSRSPGR